jgi:hypothetical protein
MALTPGTRLGVHEVTAQIVVGGPRIYSARRGVQRREKGPLRAAGQRELDADALAALVGKCEAALESLDRSRPMSSTSSR